MSFAERCATVCAALGLAAGLTAGGLEPLRIGVLGADDALARGVAAAVAEVNREGGIAGRPLVAVRVATPRPWFDSAARTARLAFESDLVALIGAEDGAAAHAAAQVATRRRIPFVTLSAEESLTRALDPWIFRGVPADGAQARAVLRHAPNRARVVIVVPGGREGRERTAALRQACDERRAEVVSVVRFERGTLHGRPARGLANVLLLWLDAEPALTFLRGVERDGLPRILAGSMRLDDPRFLREVPAVAEGLVLPVLRADGDADPGCSGGDVRADLGYDLTWALAEAGRRGSATPEGLRAGLAAGSQAGRTGNFGFDPRGNRRGEIRLGILRDGVLVCE